MTDPRTPRTEAPDLLAELTEALRQSGLMVWMGDPRSRPRPLDEADAALLLALMPRTVERSASTLGSSERLAAALRHLRKAAFTAAKHIVVVTDYPQGVEALFEAIDVADEALAADPALSDPDAERQRAIGEAVERLPHGCLLGQWDDESGWAVFSHDMEEVKGSGPTLPAAIAAALPAAQEPER
jgi:hypothetical protein